MTGKYIHFSLHVMAPLLFGGRDPVSLPRVIRTYLTPAGFVSSCSNICVFSPGCRIRASVLQMYSLLWSVPKTKRLLPVPSPLLTPASLSLGLSVWVMQLPPFPVLHLQFVDAAKVPSRKLGPEGPRSLQYFAQNAEASVLMMPV